MLFWILLIPLLATTGIAVYNAFTAPMLSRGNNRRKNFPKVSVLIPARNEEENIWICLESVASQSYPNMEVIVLDDNSTDETREIIEDIQEEYPLVKVLDGSPLPTGWIGKNWACHQLAMEATGEFFLFIDADVFLKPGAVESAIDVVQKYNAHAITTFPTQKTDTIGEKITVPILNWMLLTLLPLRYAARTKKPRIAAANGQFFLFKSDVYNRIGGHKTLSNAIAEDLVFMRRLKRYKYKAVTLLDSDFVECRMYDSLRAAIRGFSKSFYPGFEMNIVSYLACLFAITTVYLAPFVLVFFHLNYLILIGIIIINRLLISKISNQKSLLNVLLHPVHILLFFYIGIYSLNLAKKKKLRWKDRYY